MDDTRASRVGKVLYFGLGLIALGMLGLCLTFVASLLLVALMKTKAVTILFTVFIWSIVIGIVLSIVGLLMGFRTSRPKRHKAPVQTGKVYIQSRFMVDRYKEMVFGDVPNDELECKYYVQVVFEDGSKKEFQCAGITYMAAGEGMNAEIEYQADWLGKVTPIMGERTIGPMGRMQ